MGPHCLRADFLLRAFYGGGLVYDNNLYHMLREGDMDKPVQAYVVAPSSLTGGMVLRWA